MDLHTVIFRCVLRVSLRFPAQASESRIIIRANALTSRSVGYPEQWLIIARLNYPTVAGKSALKSPHNKCHRLLEKLQH